MTVHKVDSIMTLEMMEKLDNQTNTYFRFQNKEHEVGEESWGMIYRTAEEAIEDGSDVLDGKSCMDTLVGVWRWSLEFGNESVLLVFDGRDSMEIGHDGELVCHYWDSLHVFDYNQVKEFIESECDFS